jgi:hypothetical protein
LRWEVEAISIRACSGTANFLRSIGFHLFNAQLFLIELAIQWGLFPVFFAGREPISRLELWRFPYALAVCFGQSRRGSARLARCSC